MKDLLLEEWQEFCKKQCGNAYSTAVTLAILLLWEQDAIARQTEMEIVKGLGLSGAQYEMAINFASSHRPVWMIEEK